MQSSTSDSMMNDVQKKSVEEKPIVPNQLISEEHFDTKLKLEKEYEQNIT